ncbi:unnamed protein product [Rhodiola kirilowii]
MCVCVFFSVGEFKENIDGRSNAENALQKITGLILKELKQAV